MLLDQITEMTMLTSNSSTLLKCYYYSLNVIMVFSIYLYNLCFSISQLCFFQSLISIIPFSFDCFWRPGKRNTPSMKERNIVIIKTKKNMACSTQYWKFINNFINPLITLVYFNNKGGKIPFFMSTSTTFVLYTKIDNFITIYAPTLSHV